MPMKRKKPIIFISHIHEDAQIANLLKEYINNAFLGFFNIFVSSDGASIRAGDNWSANLEKALQEAEFVMVLISSRSIERRWIYFESGGAYFLGKRVIPVCIHDFSLSEIGLPLSWLEAIQGRDYDGSKSLIEEIARNFELNCPKVDIKMLTRLLAGNIAPALPHLGGEVAVRPFPLFLLADASGSMAGETISTVRIGLEKLIDFLQQPNLNVNFMPIFSLITFGSKVRPLIPPTPIINIKSIPKIDAEGATNLGEALNYLATLLNDPLIVPRRSLPPVIIVILDGTPSDNWREGLKEIDKLPWGRKAVRLCLALGNDLIMKCLKKLEVKVFCQY